MKPKCRQFVAFYINRLEFFSHIGVFPMRWSDSKHKFTQGSIQDLLLNVILSLSIIVEVIYTTVRTGIYLLFTSKAGQELNEKVLLISWTVIAHGSLFGITTLWKGGALVRLAATSVVKNIAKLQVLIGITKAKDPIRTRFLYYGHWYWALLLVYILGILELYYVSPNSPIFLYSATNFGPTSSHIAWVPFLVITLFNTGFYIGMLSFFGHYLRMCSVSFIQGTILLRPRSSRPCRFLQAKKWYNQSTIMLIILNESIGPALLMSTGLHLAGLSLAVFTIIRLTNQLSTITYCLYYVIFVQVIMYTLAAYETMGMIPATTTEFLARWKYFVGRKRYAMILASMRPQGMNFSDLFMYKKPQFLLISNIGLNLVLFFLTLDN